MSISCAKPIPVQRSAIIGRFKHFYAITDDSVIKIEIIGHLLRKYGMSKREIIDFIIDLNRGARPEFLAQFPVEELTTYLEQLMSIDTDQPLMAV